MAPVQPGSRHAVTLPARRQRLGVHDRQRGDRAGQADVEPPQPGRSGRPRRRRSRPARPARRGRTRGPSRARRAPGRAARRTRPTRRRGPRLVAEHGVADAGRRSASPRARASSASGTIRPTEPTLASVGSATATHPSRELVGRDRHEQLAAGPRAPTSAARGRARSPAAAGRRTRSPRRARGSRGQLLDVRVRLAEVRRARRARTGSPTASWPGPGRRARSPSRSSSGARPRAASSADRSCASSATTWPSAGRALHEVGHLVDQHRVGERPPRRPRRLRRASASSSSACSSAFRTPSAISASKSGSASSRNTSRAGSTAGHTSSTYLLHLAAARHRVLHPVVG